MANITGTNGNDVLTGTAAEDTIQGLGGNDHIIGSNGIDTIDGGTGYDTVEYGSNFDIQVVLAPEITVSKFDKNNSNSVTEDRLFGIDSIIAASQGTIITQNLPVNTTLDVDLSKNQLTYSSPSISKKTVTIKNFTEILGGTNNSRLAGNDADNRISTIGSLSNGQSVNTNSVIVGSKGNDTFFANESDTLDYGNLGHAVTFDTGVVNEVFEGGGSFTAFYLGFKKGTFGTDGVAGTLKKIVGAVNQTNTIDVSDPKNSLGSLDVNLANNSLKLNSSAPAQLPGGGDIVSSLPFEVLNFVNVIGGKNNDKIVGANKNGKLTGGGGNDTITGGSKNDRITGTDANARGVGECDTLTGGSGRDKFILGDKNGAYYVGKGKDDYALITDFNLFQDSINLGGFKNYSFAAAANNTIELYSGKDVKTRDLIAKIQISGGISSNNANSRSIAGSSSNLDSLISKVDIVSEPTA
jgi:Ca2+-binding RTX toxin-like protein